MLLPLADTITPLMTANFTYLFLINAVIGVFEGRLLKWWFGGGKRSIWWMLAANYLSAWIGFLALIWIIEPRIRGQLGSRPIERINLLVAEMVSIAFAITVVVEAGFVHIVTDRARRSPGRTLLGTLCVNAISYVIICYWFLAMSFTLPVAARVTAMSDLGRLPSGTLYWVDPMGQVMARQLESAESSQPVGRVTKSNQVEPYQLYFVRAAGNQGRAQMDVTYSTSIGGIPGTPINPPETIVLNDAGPADGFPADYWDQDRMLNKSVLDARAADHRQVQVNFDEYRQYMETLVPGGPTTNLSIGLANMQWWIKQPTVLPDDKIVFEWEHQIVLFDPHTTRLAFVALGSCPAFIPRQK